MIRLRVGFLAEFAVFGAGKMITAVNIFDACSPTEPETPPLCIVQIVEERSAPIHFSGDLGAGLGQGVIVIKRMGSIDVPDFGHFEWIVAVDGQRLGELPLHILEAVPARTS